MAITPSFVKKTDILLSPDNSRVILRPFLPKNKTQIRNIISRIMAFTEVSVGARLDAVMNDFSSHHENIRQTFINHCDIVSPWFPAGAEMSEQRKLLIGAYFTNEYSFESAALFNPSIVAHPDQSGLPEGSLRFIMSLRATGEGHISSLTFRTGVIDRDSAIAIYGPGKYAVSAVRKPNPSYNKQTFSLKLSEMGIVNDFSIQAMALLKDTFTFSELADSIKKVPAQNNRARTQPNNLTGDKMLWLASSNYETEIPSNKQLSDFVIFPDSPAEQNGIEDARFVLFTDDNGNKTYYATYTAYDGRAILPQMIETRDFSHFKMLTLNGKVVENKGMALFPRKINGKYAMLSRQDNENLFIMYSDNIHFWHEAELIMKPLHDWELVQSGNCGSPMETEEGWLVITHGVGPVRRYCISAILLDKNDPSRVTGRLEKPLIMPNEIERPGYVPNVVYTCGAFIHGRNLILPYAISDMVTTAAVVDLNKLLKELKASSWKSGSAGMAV